MLADHFGEVVLPSLVIAACGLVVVVTVTAQWVRRRSERRRAGPIELQMWQESSGRVIDQWMHGVDAELAAVRSAPVADSVPLTEDPLGLTEAIETCPDGPLALVLTDLRRAAGRLLEAARHEQPPGAEVAEAQQAYFTLRSEAAARLAEAGAAAAAN